MLQRIKYFFVLAIAVFLTTASCVTAPKQEITPSEFLRHIQVLASDDMKGRGNGTPELERAAHYIRHQFERARLLPGFNDSYFHSFPIRIGSRLGGRNSLVFKTEVSERTLELGRDYMPVSFGGERKVETPLVFAGYGITAPEFDYDDYGNVDVKNKIVVVLDLEPQRSKADSVFGGTADTQHSLLQTKVLNARNHGAVGIIIFTGPAHISSDVSELPARGEGFSVDEMGIPGARVTLSTIEDILSQAGLDVEQVQTGIDADLKPRSAELRGASVEMAMDVVTLTRRVANVVGKLPGTDDKLRDEVIVVGAHYDHLGLGYRGSMSPRAAGQIHNGADDNASGVAGLVEIAEKLALDPGGTRRSILFVAFAGEEMGVLGSTHFINHPPVPKEKIVAMFNMDMIGRPEDKRLLVGGVGTGAEFSRIVEIVNRRYKFKLTIDKSGVSASDHTPFVLQGIPVLFFFTGVHTDYHRPSDDWEKINAGGGAGVARFVSDVIRLVDVQRQRPTFVEVKVQKPPSGRRGGPRPWFGSVPDFTYEGEGYRFQTVMPGSPAAEAGLKAKDILIEFAGKKIKNIYDYTAALGAQQPGDEVEVVVLRDGESLKVKVKLVRRR